MISRKFCIHLFPQQTHLRRHHLPRYLCSKSSLPSTYIIQQEINNSQSIQRYTDHHGQLVPLHDISSSSSFSASSSSSSMATGSYIQQVQYLFLPKGYPNSIENGYMNYITYQFCGYLTSTAGSVLSTQSLLYALGLGDGAIPLAATLNWIIKDGLGQFGGVIFASLINNQFDQNPKRWRMISSIVMDMSAFLELLTPLAPKSFLFLASLANIGKNISYLSASASRVAIHKSFTKHENLADLTAKTGSQTILSSLLGTSLGIYISTLVNHSYPLTFSAFVGCSVIHLSCTYFSLRSVAIKTLSEKRLNDIITNYYESVKRMNPSSIPTILTPQEMSRRESIIPGLRQFFKPNDNSPVIIGANISEIFPTISDFKRAQELYSNLPYLVTAVTSSPSHRIHITLYQHTTDIDALHAILLAHLIQFLLPSFSSSAGSHIHWDLMNHALACYHSNQYHTKELLQQLYQYWIVDLFLLETRRARIIFDEEDGEGKR